MKILHVETGRQFLGGPQQVVYLMRGLAALGIGGTLVCPPGSGIDNAARAAGLPVRNLYCAGDIDLPFAYRLGRYIRESAPDVVHCHSRRGADVLGGLAARFAGVPAVVSRRVDNTEPRLASALRYQPFRKVVAISAAVADALRAQGIDDDKLVVIRSAVDADAVATPVDRAELCSSLDIPAQRLLVAAAGQLIPRKGHRHLLDAFARMGTAGPSPQLVLFGDGELADALRSQATALGIADRVTFAGFRDDLDRLLGAVDLFVHPALAEGLGVVTLKAAAAGVPVVAFAAGGLTEAVADGETGVLVPAGDVAALAAAIAGLCADTDRRAALGAAGRERMRRDFSIAVLAEQHAELYASLADRAQ